MEDMDHDSSNRRLRNKLDNSELVKTGFWVGQVFMLIATVLGVYLASQEGLSQAIRFSEIDDMQNNYYLQRSLYDEVSDNVEGVRNYVKTIEENKPFDLTKFHPELQTYIWDTMRYSQNTLQTPSRFLSEIRRFYAEVEDLVRKGEERTYGRSFFMPKLIEAADRMEQETLAALEQNLENLKAELAKNDVDID
ncbi:hypothetical protein [Marinobacterium lutimaris]|uniref:Chemotaxis methyl-accepting receptor HlyB-like 4HB MCP domain-containing protein n=1 Tax=Marinobacterium lutimaris TaxID=568106 RepID=A0A1H5Z9E5_9GAMM|nr:hypothetical protein [Marinobacterium lutimaris]SEG31976.1 hypothetical protein SAMN05444390_1012042 [Marinobacterium lutimaris]